MKKYTYIQPKMTVQPVLADMSVMLLNSNSAPEAGTAPKRRMDVNPVIQNSDSTKVF